MRSMTRSYFGGSSYLTPSSVMYSAPTSPRPRSLMPLISASGNVFSRPTRTPTRFIYVEYPFAKKEGKYLCRWCLSNRHPAPPLTASMHRSRMPKAAFYRACVTIRHQSWLFPNCCRRVYGDLKFKENGYILLRPTVALLALAAFLVSLASLGHIVAQDSKDKKDAKQETKQQDAKPAEPAKQNGKDVKFTAEQVVESVI